MFLVPVLLLKIYFPPPFKFSYFFKKSFVASNYQIVQAMTVNCLSNDNYGVVTNRCQTTCSYTDGGGHLIPL